MTTSASSSPGEASAGSTSTPPPPPPFGTGRPRQLRRRPCKGHIAGVCAGVAEYFGVDVVIVRIAAVVLAFSGPGVLAYALAWVLVPAAKHDESADPPARWGRHDRGAQIFGIVLLAVATSILWGGWWSPARRWMFPFGLIVLGGWLILRRDDGDDPDSVDVRGGRVGAPEPTAAATATPPAGIDPAAAGFEGSTGAESSTSTTASEGVADPTIKQPVGGSPWPWGRAPGWPGGLQAWDQRHRHRRAPLTEEERAARRRRRMVFPVVMGALLLWTGVAFIAGVGIQTALAIALCLVGMGFVLGAFVGGSKALILPAVVLAAALVTTSVIDIPLSGPVGRRTWVPQTVAQLSDRYELSVGEGTLDLTDLDVGRGDDVDLVASVGIGHLRVEVPDDVAVEVHARAGAGDALLLGESNSGVGVEVDRAYGEGAASGTLHLDLEVGMGQVELVVRRPDDGRPERTAPPTPTGAPAPTTPSTITGA